jgi:hypothetical protein
MPLSTSFASSLSINFGRFAFAFIIHFFSPAPVYRVCGL